MFSLIDVDLSVFEDMCRSLLADVQQRLIYRAQVYIKSQINDYEPSAGDIAYPEKLEMIEVPRVIYLFSPISSK